MLTLKYKNRKTGEKGDGLKAVYYGGKGDSQAIFIEPIEFEKVYREAGQSGVVNLDGEKKLQALVQDVQYDPVKYTPIHVDFYTVEKGEKINAPIPLEFIGESEAIKTSGGTLVKVLHEVEVEAEASHLPHKLEVDISALSDVDSVIKLKDLKLPKGVEFYNIDEENVVASIAVAEEEDLSEPVEGDISQVEIEEKGKKESDEEEKSE